MKIAKLSRIIASVLMGGLGMAAATLATFVQAQNYPGRPITLILPLGAGTGSDVAFRILAEKMSTAFGQQMVVENAPGAAGIIGAQRVARAAPDGYSLGGFNNAIMAILPNILPSAGYDPFKSFEPISMVVAIPTALLVHPSLPVSSVKNLIAIAKARPRELNYGTGGVGSPQHIASAMFASMAGIQLVHVPYKSAALAMLDLAGGQLQILIVGLGGTPMSLIKVGKMRPLAATGGQRIALLPSIPTMQEAGMPGYHFESWNALFAPANTPKEILARLNSETRKALNSPDVRSRIAEQVMEPLGTAPEQVSEIMRADTVRMIKVIKDNQIRAE